MKNHNYAITVGVALVVGGSAFLGGLFYQKHRDSLSGVTAQQLSQKLQSLGYTGSSSTGNETAGGQQIPSSGEQSYAYGNPGGASGSGGFSRSGTRRSGGFVTGAITGITGQTLTIQQQDGSTKTVTLSDSTTITTTTTGSASDLAVGKEITATGTAGTDGSVTAQTIQVRPTTTQ